MLFSLETEHPLFVKEPPSHISAEMEKVVDIPCQVRGDCFHLSVFPETLFFSFYFYVFLGVKQQKSVAAAARGK